VLARGALLASSVSVRRFGFVVGTVSSTRRDTWIRFGLAALLALVALNAFGGGYYGMVGAEGVPTEWLAGSPFSSYLVPSAILFFVVGGSFLVATIAVLARSRYVRITAVAAALIALIWIATQVAIIGAVSWLQPATACAAVLILFLTRRLRAA